MALFALVLQAPFGLRILKDVRLLVLLVRSSWIMMVRLRQANVTLAMPLAPNVMVQVLKIVQNVIPLDQILKIPTKKVNVHVRKVNIGRKVLQLV